MKSQIVGSDELGVAAAVRALGSGGVIVVPTDTVYGIAASLEHPSAIERIYDVKIRDRGKPIPILVSDRGAVERLTPHV
ncbi:MAG: L-threonylcarbamoyladenylate synthase, partial [Chloroflexota bacterium]